MTLEELFASSNDIRRIIPSNLVSKPQAGYDLIVALDDVPGKSWSIAKPTMKPLKPSIVICHEFIERFDVFIRSSV